MNEGIIPSVPDIERAVIGAILIEPEAIEKALLIIKPEAFYKPANQLLFRAIVDMYGNNIPVDQLSVAVYLQKKGELQNAGGEVAIAALMGEAVTAANIEYHCGVLLDYYNRRQIIMLCRSVEQSCYADGVDVSKIKDMLINNAFEINLKRGKKPYYNMMDAMDETSDELYAMIGSGGKISGHQTGFRLLDDMIDGLQGGDLLILAGLPETGKTSLALNMVRYLTHNEIPAAIFSMEMSLKRLCRRLISSDTRKDFSARTRRYYSKQDVQDASDSFNRLSHDPLYIIDESGLTHTMLYTRMKQLQREEGIKAVFIDHLQLMIGTTEFKGNRRLQIEEITRHMKKYAKDLNIPIILLSHLSRDSEKKERRPRLSDLRETAMIEADADIVMFIHKPLTDEVIEILNKNERKYTKEEAEHVRELIIGKNRNGATGTIYLHWEPSYTQFSSLEY